MCAFYDRKREADDFFVPSLAVCQAMQVDDGSSRLLDEGRLGAPCPALSPSSQSPTHSRYRFVMDILTESLHRRSSSSKREPWAFDMSVRHGRPTWAWCNRMNVSVA